METAVSLEFWNAVAPISSNPSGKVKIQKNPSLILPKEGPDGKAITALGAGVNNQGIFVVSADGKNYTPASVILPDTLKTIGNFAFAGNVSLVN